jgi:hypothetical protein
MSTPRYLTPQDRTDLLRRYEPEVTAPLSREPRQVPVDRRDLGVFIQLVRTAPIAEADSHYATAVAEIINR